MTLKQITEMLERYNIYIHVEDSPPHETYRLQCITGHLCRCASMKELNRFLKVFIPTILPDSPEAIQHHEKIMKFYGDHHEYQMDPTLPDYLCCVPKKELANPPKC